NATALALIEALFPAGRILPGPDSHALAATVAGYADRTSGIGAALKAALLALDARYFLGHGRTFRAASLPARRAFLQQHAQGDLTAKFIHLLSLPFRAAYVLDDANLKKVGAHPSIRVPAQLERQRW